MTPLGAHVSQANQPTHIPCPQPPPLLELKHQTKIFPSSNDPGHQRDTFLLVHSLLKLVGLPYPELPTRLPTLLPCLSYANPQERLSPCFSSPCLQSEVCPLPRGPFSWGLYVIKLFLQRQEVCVVTSTADCWKAWHKLRPLGVTLAALSPRAHLFFPTVDSALLPVFSLSPHKTPRLLSPPY